MLGAWVESFWRGSGLLLRIRARGHTGLVAATCLACQLPAGEPSLGIKYRTVTPTTNRQGKVIRYVLIKPPNSLRA